MSNHDSRTIPASSASDSIVPLQAFHPARRKKSYTMDRPNVCCSRGSGTSRMRGAAGFSAALSRCDAPNSRNAALQQEQPHGDVREIAIVIHPQLAELSRRRGKQVEVEGLGLIPGGMQRLDEGGGFRLLAGKHQRHESSATCAFVTLN